MTSFNNNDLYQILLDRLRKDRKGAISPEEFESFLRYRNLEYFNKQIGVEDVTKMNHDSLIPFFVGLDNTADSEQSGAQFVHIGTENIGLGNTLDNECAYIINAWYHNTVGGVDQAERRPIDILSSAEYHERFTNAITMGTSDYPIAYRGMLNYWRDAPVSAYVNIPVLYIQGLDPLTSYGVYLDYYRYPADPYFDYYTDSNGNITYLTDGQAAYTLQAGEEARDGKTVGQQVTSASQDLEWRDNDAIHILDMVYSDVTLAMSDPDSFEASMLERQQNVSS